MCYIFRKDSTEFERFIKLGSKMKLKSHHNVEASPSESSSSKKSLKRSLPVSFSSIALEKSLQGIHIFFCYRCVQVPVQLLSHLHIQLELSPSQIRIEILMMTIDFLWNLKSFHKTFDEGCPHYPELPSNESFPNERNWFPCGISPVRCLSDYVTHQTLKCSKLFKMLRNLSWEVVTRQVQWLQRL